MIKVCKLLILPLALIFISISFTGAYFSDNTTTTNNLTAGSWLPDPADVVINEFMANPVGTEPDNEWVELYNKGGSSIDVNGWVLYDSFDTHPLVISASNVAGGSTILNPGSFLVVGYQAPSWFSLNNSGAESVRLYNGAIGLGSLKDSISYLGTTEGFTWSSMPDGMGAFSDGHTPTPGGNNV